MAAFIGAAIVAFGAEGIGKVVVVAGILLGVIGLGLHFILMMLWFIKDKTDRG